MGEMQHATPHAAFMAVVISVTFSTCAQNVLIIKELKPLQLAVSQKCLGVYWQKLNGTRTADILQVSSHTIFTMLKSNRHF